MECSSKLDRSSSLSSNNSGPMLDLLKLPKPPPSLGRRKQRKITAQTFEVFEFSDSFPEPIEPISAFKGNEKDMSSKQPITENGNANDVNETIDRYDALRNLVINDNDTVFVEKSQTPIQETNNPFASAFLETYCNGYIDSEKSDKNPFKSKVSENDKTAFMHFTNETGIGQNEDRYAAISEANQDLNQMGEEGSSLSWSRSVMGHGKFGWSDQVLVG
jgi:hypothetical protein